MTGIDDVEALIPADDEVGFYREHGYYHSRKLLNDDQIEAAVTGSDRFYAGQLDHSPVSIPVRYLPSGSYGERLRKHDYASFHSRPLGAIVRHPLIGAVAARLAGSPEVRLWHDQLRYKPFDPAGAGSKVGWHTDRGYWKTCSSPNMLTAWILIHDCDEAMGTIVMIDGSHTWPDNTQHLDFFSSDLEGLEKRYDTGGAPIVRVPMNLKRGDVSFHHSLPIHGSGANISDRPRCAIAVHLQDTDNRYQRYVHPTGQVAQHGNDELCRHMDGQPDYTDPLPFPVLATPDALAHDLHLLRNV